MSKSTYALNWINGDFKSKETQKTNISKAKKLKWQKFKLKDTKNFFFRLEK